MASADSVPVASATVPTSPAPTCTRQSAEIHLKFALTISRMEKPTAATASRVTKGRHGGGSVAANLFDQSLQHPKGLRLGKCWWPSSLFVATNEAWRRMSPAPRPLGQRLLHALVGASSRSAAKGTARSPWLSRRSAGCGVAGCEKPLADSRAGRGRLFRLEFAQEHIHHLRRCLPRPI